jgi:hypothetical protein
MPDADKNQRRLSGLGNKFGFTIDQLAAFSAVLSSLKISAKWQS